MRKINTSWKTRLWYGVCVFKELGLAHFHHWALVDTHAVRSNRSSRSGNIGQTVAKDSTDRITSWAWRSVHSWCSSTWKAGAGGLLQLWSHEEQNIVSKLYQSNKETPLWLGRKITKNSRKVFRLRISTRKILEPCLACRSFQHVGMYFKWLHKQNIHLNLEREDLGLKRWLRSWEHWLLFQRTWIQFWIPTCQLVAHNCL